MASVLGKVTGGTGAFIPQLRRLEIQFCQLGGSSRTIREFFQSKLSAFATANPHVEITVIRADRKHPSLTAHYLNGDPKVLDVKNITTEKLEENLHLLCSQSGLRTQFDKVKPWVTENPSVQGTWNALEHGCTPVKKYEPKYIKVAKKKQDGKV